MGLLAVGTGAAGLVTVARHLSAAPPPTAKTAAVAPAGSAAPLPAPSGGRPAALPVALSIPAIGVRTRLITLGITSQGTLQVPSSTSVAGWYTGSPRPGEIGSAIIAGHIDSHTGPGVFFRLRELRPGNRVYVRQADRRLAVFQVTSVHLYPKDHFPTGQVYGPAPDAELRLITCGGTFDYTSRSYLSNVVVYSTEVR